MSNRNNMIPIPGRLHSVAVGEPVSGADEVLDDALNMEQSEINQLTVGTKNASTGTTGAYPYNGMGRVVLPKNMVNGINTLTQDMLYKGDSGSRVPNTNTIFVIQYDFILGEDITVPANCVLEFDGGSISGAYTITGTNTQIKAQDVAIFKNGIIIAGTWNCPRITSVWFNDLTNENRIKQVFNLSSENVSNYILIKEGNYTVSVSANAQACVEINSNSIVELNGTITLLPNNFTNYYIIYIEGENIRLFGKGRVVGDVGTHTGTEGQWGDCLFVYSSKNVYISDITLEKGWGDGIEIFGARETTQGDFNYASKNIFINNITCDSNRRQGISVVSAYHVEIKNCKLINTGTIQFQSPGYGIDIEPTANDSWKQSVKDVFIENCEFYENVSGAISCVGSVEHNNNIFINNCVFHSQQICLGTANNIRINDCKGIGQIYFVGGNESIEPVYYVSNSDIQSIRFGGRNAGNGKGIFNNCLFGGDDIDEVLNKVSWNYYPTVIFNNCEFVFTEHFSNNTVNSGRTFNNCIITQKGEKARCIFSGGKFSGCTIDVGQIYIQDTISFTRCIINTSVDSSYYVYNNSNSLELRNNSYLTESVPLLLIGQNLGTLYIEEKVPTSQDNISSVASKITTLTNRVEHFA